MVVSTGITDAIHSLNDLSDRLSGAEKSEKRC